MIMPEVPFTSRAGQDAFSRIKMTSDFITIYQIRSLVAWREFSIAILKIQKRARQKFADGKLFDHFQLLAVRD